MSTKVGVVGWVVVLADSFHSCGNLRFLKKPPRLNWKHQFGSLLEVSRPIRGSSLFVWWYCFTRYCWYACACYECRCKYYWLLATVCSSMIGESKCMSCALDWEEFVCVYLDIICKDIYIPPVFLSLITVDTWVHILLCRQNCMIFQRIVQHASNHSG